jgi:Outer membrane protein TOM13
MSSEEDPTQPQDLSSSGLTIPSESEAFSSLSPPSTSPPQSSSNTNNNNNDSSHEQRVVVYSPPTFWSLARGAAINLLLPFVNGMMLGLGELLAHEIAFRWGWGTTQVSCTHIGETIDGYTCCTGHASSPLWQAS